MKSETYQYLYVGEGNKTIDGVEHVKDYVYVVMYDADDVYNLGMTLLSASRKMRENKSVKMTCFDLTGTLEHEKVEEWKS